MSHTAGCDVIGRRKHGATAPQHWARPGGESGSVSAWTAVISAVLIVSAGLAVDLGAQATAHQRAYDLAAQAARTGGQAIAGTTAGGDDLTLDRASALAAANGYLTAVHADGHASVTGPTTISVTVTETYEPTLLAILGVDTLTASASAEVRLVRSVGGNER